MTTVTGRLIGAVNPQRVEMVATLVDAAGSPTVGYVASVPGELVKPVTIIADATTGTWSVDLTPNSQIAADVGDTLWAIQEGRAKDGTPQITHVVVPASGGPYWAGNIRATLSGTPTGTSSVVYLPGPAGAAGASAYQTWLAAGHTGTEADFLASLVGPPGQDGASVSVGAAGVGDTIALRSTDPTTTNARTPTAHAASHASAGLDPLTPAAIGAETAGAASGAVSTHTAAVDPHGDRAYTDTQTALRVPTSRQITAGTGMTGGGSLAADLTLAVAYGTTAGTAAQGNDARLADARTPAGTAGGDLSGTYPNPGVAKVAGVTVTGTPASGQVLTASSSSAASWQAPSGGGSTIRTADARLTPGDVALASVASWTIVTSGGTQLAASITAAVGDRIQASPSFMRTGSGCFLDLTILDSAGVISRFFGTDSATPLSEGHPSYYPQASSFPGVPGTMQIVVGAGEVDGTGKVTIALAYKGSGGETIYADATYPWYMLLTNLGPEPA